MSTIKALVLGCASALWAVGCGPPASVAGLHQGCPDAGCAGGQSCLTNCSWACQSTCEISCANDFDCPGGLHCVAIADGPPGKTCQ